ncbi:hypothetical protein [Yersinia phage vB_YenM_P778]
MTTLTVVNSLVFFLLWLGLMGYTATHTNSECKHCSGSGNYHGTLCPFCGGSGKK